MYLCAELKNYMSVVFDFYDKLALVFFFFKSIKLNAGDTARLKQVYTKEKSLCYIHIGALPLVPKEDI